MSAAIPVLGTFFKGITAAAGAIGTKIVGAGAAMFGMGGAAAAGTGVLGGVLKNALAGGVMAKLSGGSFKRGALAGGAMGLLGGLGGQAQQGMQATLSTSGNLGTDGLLSGIENPAQITGPANVGASTVGPAGSVPGATQPSQGGGLLNWFSPENDPKGARIGMVGNVIGGLGQGLMSHMQDRSERKERRRQERSYDIDYGPSEYALKPQEKPRFKFDSESNSIVYG